MVFGDEVPGNSYAFQFGSGVMMGYSLPGNCCTCGVHRRAGASVLGIGRQGRVHPADARLRNLSALTTFLQLCADSEQSFVTIAGANSLRGDAVDVAMQLDLSALLDFT